MHDGYFTQEFLESLPSDDLEARAYLGNEFIRLHQTLANRFQHSTGGSKEHTQSHTDYIEALAILRAFRDARQLTFQLPPVGPHETQNVQQIALKVIPLAQAWVTALAERTTNSFFDEKTDQYTELFKGVQTYVFAPQDLQRVQQLINELRDMITASNIITADHKRRLLRRLEAMQSEFHKSTSDIDRFWGFIAEAGIVTRKFGEDLKPITERVMELGKIVITVVMAKEGIKALPEISKLLGN